MWMVKVSKVSMVVVVGVALLAGGCTPRMKTAGYVGGTALVVSGATMRLDAEYCGCLAFENLDVLVAEYLLGIPITIVGALIVAATVASPSKPPAPATLAAPPLALTPPLAPTVPALAPSRSPSTPSASLLAPVLSRSLPVRSGVRLGFD